MSSESSCTSCGTPLAVGTRGRHCPACLLKLGMEEEGSTTLRSDEGNAPFFAETGMSGRELAHYEVSEEISRGGMGIVYRAKDTKLGRDVAIKVLPEEFTQDAMRLARFEREAKLLAALNHPHIATLHGLEEAEGRHFLVMELVPGETLAERIARAPLSTEEVLKIFQQIADALEAAHEKGIVHRDLKPANIMITPEGRAKLLDFGLGKALQAKELESDLSRAGAILGTTPYMSPEQARGESIDKRTDNWAFGCCLYEALAGKKAFDGERVTDILSAVIGTEPDWSPLPKHAPHLRRLLVRCLRKDRRERLRDIGDARIEIQELLDGETDGSTQELPAVSAPSRARVHVAWGLAVLVAALAGAIAWSVMRVESRTQNITRFVQTLPPGVSLTGLGAQVVALAPDGTRVVYVANGRLYLREMEQLEGAPIRGTDTDAGSPFFSPDGQWVGFYSVADGRLKKISAAGGAAVTLCECDAAFGASWEVDDTIVFSQGAAGIFRVAANGGPPEVLVPMDADRGEIAHGPQMLPDGKTVLFTLGTLGPAGTNFRTTGTNWDQSQIVTQSLETGERRVLIAGGSDARYASTGHLLYAVGATLLAVPFDPERLEVTGAPVPVVEGVGRAPANLTGAAHASFSDSGTLVYVRGAVQNSTSFVWVDREGREEPVASEPQEYAEFNLSPDGTKIAVRVTAENTDVWIYDLERDTQTRLTFDPGTERFPLWTPDGRRVVFGGAKGIFWKVADGTGEVEPIGVDPSGEQDPQLAALGREGLRPEAFSPDGTVLVYQDLSSGRDLGMVSLQGESAPTLVLETEFEERNAELSPDGRYIAYESNESGEFEVYVRPFPDVNAGRWQVSSGGGQWPFWAPDGQELFYLAGQTEIVAVATSTDPRLTLGRRETLFDMEPYAGTTNFSRRIDISPDGERFLLLLKGTATQEDIVVVLNWFEELKHLAPTN